MVVLRFFMGLLIYWFAVPFVFAWAFAAALWPFVMIYHAVIGG